MAVGARRINMGILFTNRKLPSIHSESVPRSRSKVSTYSYGEKLMLRRNKKRPRDKKEQIERDKEG